MEEQICNRCGLKLKENESELCEGCKVLVEQAIKLIETDAEVAKYYAQAEEEQQKAEVKLEKLKYLYHNNANPSKAALLLKSTGKGIKKIYKFSILDAGINATKKILSDVKKAQGENNEPITEEDLLVEQILELEEFIETDPLEFVIFEYIYSDVEKGIKKEEPIQNHSKNFLVEPVKHFTKEKFNRLNKDTQRNVGIAVIVILSLIFIGISFL